MRKSSNLSSLRELAQLIVLQEFNYDRKLGEISTRNFEPARSIREDSGINGGPDMEGSSRFDSPFDRHGRRLVN